MLSLAALTQNIIGHHLLPQDREMKKNKRRVPSSHAFNYEKRYSSESGNNDVCLKLLRKGISILNPSQYDICLDV